MHRTPLDVVPRHDLVLDGHPLKAGHIYSTHCWEDFDRRTGDIHFKVPPAGGNLCTERVTLPKKRYHEFWIRWEWVPSTNTGRKALQMGALAFLAPIWLGADLLIGSDLPVLRDIGHRIHPKRSH